MAATVIQKLFRGVRCVGEEEEEGLFKADAVNEEGFERDRATQVRRRVPPCYVPRGDSPVSLLATILRE